MVDKALRDDEFLKKQNILVHEYEALLQLSGGDGRKLYNILELVTSEAPTNGEPLTITNDYVRSRIQQNLTRFDKGGEQHYDIASAFIKSIRGSDPNGAIYWLARMIDGGEDVKFIARRMVIAASEDIGMANPNALLMATTALQAVQAIGWPESRIILAQAAVYLATSPKSNASYLAINLAQRKVKETGTLPIPLHLRNAPTKLMKELDYGKDYQYAHDFVGNFTPKSSSPTTSSAPRFIPPSTTPPRSRSANASPLGGKASTAIRTEQ
jgi:putative ATPase